MAATTITSAASAADAILNHSAPSYNFRFSPFLRNTYQVGLSADRPICKAFQTGHCANGTRCPERHVMDVAGDDAGGGGSKGAQSGSGGLNSLVCKHWLRGLCKKGEHCEFLHEYNLRKMPECNFFMRNGYCSNGDECLYLHIDPLSRLPPCPHYDMGFCPLGPTCSKKHVRRRPCPFYLAGFCPDGPACRAGAHPKWSKDLERPTAKGDEKDEEAKAAAAAAAAATEAGGHMDDEARRARDGGQFQRDDGRFGGRHDGGGRGRGGKWRGGGGRGRYRGRGH
jgi:cleavage and polyadenylation specificity factor subunit 4